MEEKSHIELKVESVETLVYKLPKYFTISCASRRNSGKTVIISELIKALLKQKKVDMVVVMSGSARLNEDYSFLPPKLVIPFSERILANAWATQEKKKQNDRQHLLFVMDDCLASPEAVRNPMLTKIWALGRHVQISAILISQHTAVLLSPIIKANSDIILWSKLNRQQLEVLWLSTTNIDKKEFIRLSEKYGGVDYQFMLLDNYKGSSDPSEYLAVVKAKAPN